MATTPDHERQLQEDAAQLQRLGYATISYPSAARFLKAFDAAPERIDLVIIDVVMPGMSGVQLVSALRQAGYDVPILLMTADRTPDVAQQACVEPGADGARKPQGAGVVVPDEERPDVRAAEQRIAAALARVSQADAARYEPVSLSENFRSGSNILEVESGPNCGQLTGRMVDQPWGDICDGAEKRRMLLETCALLGISPQQAIAMGVISVLWIVVGFSLAFGESQGGWIGDPTSFFMFQNVLDGQPWSLAPTIPLVLFALFQLKFAIITPALIIFMFLARAAAWATGFPM